MNAAKRVLGRIDVPLDDLGARQARALGAVPAIGRASRVVSSPLLRARQTASALGPPVGVDPRWVEIDYGVFDGESVEEAVPLWSEWAADIAYVPEGGESLAAVGERVRAACAELWEEASTSDLVVVSHVSPIKAAVAWVLGVGDEVCRRMFVDVASVTVVGANDGSPTLQSFNQTHLRPGE